MIVRCQDAECAYNKDGDCRARLLLIRANGACGYKVDRRGAFRAYKEPVDEELFNSLEKRCEADFPEGESAPSPRDTHFPQESDSRQ